MELGGQSNLYEIIDQIHPTFSKTAISNQTTRNMISPFTADLEDVSGDDWSLRAEPPVRSEQN